MVPEGWTNTQLGNVASLQRGFDLPSGKRLDGPFPIISSSGVSGYHNVAKVPGPGLITGRYGTVGDVYFVEDDFWPLNTALWVKDLFENDIRYVYYLLNTLDFAKYSDKTGVPGVNRNDLHRIRVVVPPLAEQRKIAEILSVWDRAIETTERLLANATTQKRALMQQLLTGKRRFPECGYCSKPGVTSNIDQRTAVPEGWTETRLGNVAFLQRGFDLPGRERMDGPIPIISSSGFSGYHNVAKVIGPGLVTGRYGTIGDVYFVETDFWPLNTALWVKDFFGNDVRYVYYLLTTIDFSKFSDKTGVPGINRNDLHAIRVFVPSVAEQRKIAESLGNCDLEIELIEKKLAHLRAEKKALMQQLLTGKRRVAA